MCTHGGGASMVTQSNDTDFHQWTRKRFIENRRRASCCERPQAARDFWVVDCWVEGGTAKAQKGRRGGPRLADLVRGVGTRSAQGHWLGGTNGQGREFTPFSPAVLRNNVNKIIGGGADAITRAMLRSSRAFRAGRISL